MNVTVVADAGWGYLTAYPAGAGRPGSSNLNFGPSQIVPNLVAVKTGVGGLVKIYNGSDSPADMVVDIAGYFTS